METMRALLMPRGIAVVGASQRGGRGAAVVRNLCQLGYAGAVYGINPRYQEVHGYPCVAAVTDLPDGIDCLVVAVGADAACDVLEEAFARGIRAAVVLAAGFGEGGHGEARARRLAALVAQGMAICGPNCYGLLNVGAAVSAFSGPIPQPLRRGKVAVVSQSGGLAATVFTSLMEARGLGFAYVISCGNQLGATVEDFAAWCVDDPAVEVVAILVEALKRPKALLDIARRAAAQRKSLILYQVGQSKAGQVLIRSHTGALAGNREVLAAFLRRCGIIQASDFEEFIETIELFANAPRDLGITDDLVVLSGSGGGAAMVTDALEEAGMPLAEFEPEMHQRLRAAQADFASVTNPIDGTGAIYDNPEVAPKLFAALVADRRRPPIAVSVSVRAGASPRVRRLADCLAAAARDCDRTFASFQYTPLGGPLDLEMIETLHAAKVSVLLGIRSAMRALRHLPTRRAYWLRGPAPLAPASASPLAAAALRGDDYLALRDALGRFGVPAAAAAVATSADEAVAAQRRFAGPVAIKAQAPGLLHKSDIGGVRLGCTGATAVADAYEAVTAAMRGAGFAAANTVLVQPMQTGVAEAYAGVIDDPLFGPAIVFGLGGIFVEIMGGARTEMAPLGRDEALAMIGGVAGAAILTGARGRREGDIEALADLLVGLGRFALAHAGSFRALDLNPIVVKPRGEGVVAVDIAVDIAVEGAAETGERTP